MLRVLSVRGKLELFVRSTQWNWTIIFCTWYGNIWYLVGDFYLATWNHDTPKHIEKQLLFYKDNQTNRYSWAVSSWTEDRKKNISPSLLVSCLFITVSLIYGLTNLGNLGIEYSFVKYCRFVPYNLTNWQIMWTKLTKCSTTWTFRTVL